MCVACLFWRGNCKKTHNYFLIQIISHTFAVLNTATMDKDFITLEESKDKLLGKIGTPERDAYEEELKTIIEQNKA